jgi:hypothetical protein
MVRFDLRLYNFPAEKLFKPRQRLKPIEVPMYVKRALSFKEESFETLNEESDVIILVDYFSFDLGFDNIADIKEYIFTHELYNLIKGINNEEAIIKITTALKYLFAAKQTLQGLVADDTIFSFHLPYLAEASFDLECSVTLIKEWYFKQSLQTLRNVIEVTLTHAFFSLHDVDYNDLVESQDHRIPSLKKMIKFLRTESLLTAELERQIFELYKTLSGAVHSEILKLNTGRSSADYDTFNEWYETFIRAVQIHFAVIIRMIEIGI